MELMTWAAAAAGSDGGVNPLFFVLGALALIVVSTLGPLSRLHERRSELRKEATRRATDTTAAKVTAEADAAGTDTAANDLAATENRTD